MIETYCSHGDVLSFCWHVRSRLLSRFASAFLFWALPLASRTSFRVYSSASAWHLDSQVTNSDNPGLGARLSNNPLYPLCLAGVQTTNNLRHLCAFCARNCLHGGRREESVP